MDRIELLEPLLQGGIRNTNFFNGRLLSAEDLRTEQTAARRQRAQLGRAAGAGVVAGLEVTRGDAGGGAATVNVAAGLAVNEAGQALELPGAMQVALVRAPQAAGGPAELFKPCERQATTATLVAGDGVYVLALTPASGFAERAPASGLGGNPLTSPGCGSRYAVEGVQFRLVKLDLNTNAWITAETRARLAVLTGADDAASLSRLRNLLAHLCYGDDRPADFTRDPFRPDFTNLPAAQYGALDALRAQGALTACDVPLALLYWTGTGVRFVDAWAVRRGPVAPGASGRWAVFGGARRAREAEASFYQFAEQLRETREREQNLETLSAAQFFESLPPVGLLPATGVGGAPGFNPQNFFAGQLPRRATYIHGAQVEPLVRTALAYAPINLRERNVVWLYRVVDGATSVRPYYVFTSAHVPYAAGARFDIDRYNFGNFAYEPALPS